ncbi:MAG: YdeI/OmpD-associated family protein [Terracidiphilus sp.]
MIDSVQDGILDLPLTMSPPTKRSFTATLEPLQSGLGWVIARIPFDIAKAWPVRRRLRVRGEIEGFAFRSSLFAHAGGGGHFLLVNRKMQAAAHARAGSRVRIALEPDLEEREAPMPPELARALKEDRLLRKWFDGLSEYMRRTFGALVDEAKTPESRKKMAGRIAERLLLTMEGELETPPILKAAFARQPLAEAGWKAMTPTQRRNSLLAIFYYESAEARGRRAAKVVELALKAARKPNAASK